MVVKESGMEASANRWIQKTLVMSRRLAEVANRGEAKADDDSCAVLFGVVRDCAYKIMGRAEEERQCHRRQGRWEGGEDSE